MNTDSRRELIHAGVTDGILASFYETYNELGSGFVESIYEGALCVVLRDKGISFERQPIVPVYFRGEPLAEFRLDLVVEGCVIVEAKAVSQLTKAHEVQLVNYLKASRLPVGLLLNFGVRPEFRRKVF